MVKLRAGALIAALLLGGGGVARAERPRVVVMPIAGEPVDAAFRTRVTKALSQGLVDSGIGVVSPSSGFSETSTAAEIAAASGANFLMRGTVEAEGRSYTFRLEMVDGKSGAVVASREDRCEICTEAEALETANTAASTLKTQAFSRTSASNVAPAPGGAVASEAAGTPSNPHVRVVIAEALDLPPTLDEFHGRVRGAIEALVHDAGLGLAVPPPGSAARCTTRDCLKELALTVGATDVLAVSGSRNDVQGFALGLELWNAARDEGAKSQGWCNFCTGPQMVTAAEDLGRPLLAQLAAREGTTPGVAVAPPPAATDEGGGGVSKGRVLLGAGLFAAGAAAVTIGGITWHRAGTPTDCLPGGPTTSCRSTYGDKNLGISLVVGGAVAAVVGGWLFATGVTYHGPQVAIGRNTVALVGSF
jgi:TolB-like protein